MNLGIILSIVTKEWFRRTKALIMFAILLGVYAQGYDGIADESKAREEEIKPANQVVEFLRAKAQDEKQDLGYRVDALVALYQKGDRAWAQPRLLALDRDPQYNESRWFNALGYDRTAFAALKILAESNDTHWSQKIKAILQSAKNKEGTNFILAALLYISGAVSFLERVGPDIPLDLLLSEEFVPPYVGFYDPYYARFLYAPLYKKFLSLSRYEEVRRLFALIGTTDFCYGMKKYLVHAKDESLAMPLSNFFSQLVKEEGESAVIKFMHPRLAEAMGICILGGNQEAAGLLKKYRKIKKLQNYDLMTDDNLYLAGDAEARQRIVVAFEKVVVPRMEFDSDFIETPLIVIRPKEIFWLFAAQGDRGLLDLINKKTADKGKPSGAPVPSYCYGLYRIQLGDLDGVANLKAFLDSVGSNSSLSPEDREKRVSAFLNAIEEFHCFHPAMVPILDQALAMDLGTTALEVYAILGQVKDASSAALLERQFADLKKKEEVAAGEATWVLYQLIQVSAALLALK